MQFKILGNQQSQRPYNLKSFIPFNQVCTTYLKTN